MFKIRHCIEQLLKQEIKAGNSRVQEGDLRSVSVEENEDRNSTDDDGNTNSNYFRFLKDRHEDKEATDEEEDDGEDQVDFDGSLQVRLLPPEVENSGDRDHDEERLNKGGEVDEDEDI